jgi:hypothetical protein
MWTEYRQAVVNWDRDAVVRLGRDKPPGESPSISAVLSHATCQCWRPDRNRSWLQSWVFTVRQSSNAHDRSPFLFAFFMEKKCQPRERHASDTLKKQKLDTKCPASERGGDEAKGARFRLLDAGWLAAHLSRRRIRNDRFVVVLGKLQDGSMHITGLFLNEVAILCAAV